MSIKQCLPLAHGMQTKRRRQNPNTLKMIVLIGSVSMLREVILRSGKQNVFVHFHTRKLLFEPCNSEETIPKTFSGIAGV